MKQQIEIKGMSCGGCVNNVEKALGQIDGVNTVKVSLTPPQAIIEAEQSINTKQLQHALTKAGGYSIAGEVDENSNKSGGSCCC
jgi:copper chaperone CopZ